MAELTTLESAQIRCKNGVQRGLQYLTWGLVGGAALGGVAMFSGIGTVASGLAGGWSGLLGLGAITGGTVGAGALGFLPSLTTIAVVGLIGAGIAFGLGFLSGVMDDKPVNDALKDRKYEESLDNMNNIQQARAKERQAMMSQQLDAASLAQRQAMMQMAGPIPQMPVAGQMPQMPAMAGQMPQMLQGMPVPANPAITYPPASGFAPTPLPYGIAPPPPGGPDRKT